MKYYKIVADVAKNLEVGFLYRTYSPENEFEFILTAKWKLDIP